MAIKFDSDWLLCRKLSDNMFFKSFCCKKNVGGKLVFVNRGLKRNWQLFTTTSIPNKQNLDGWRKTQSSLVFSWKKARIWHLQFDHNGHEWQRIFCYDKSPPIKTKRRQSGLGERKVWKWHQAWENLATFFKKIQSRPNVRCRFKNYLDKK